MDPGQVLHSRRDQRPRAQVPTLSYLEAYQRAPLARPLAVAAALDCSAPSRTGLWQCRPQGVDPPVPTVTPRRPTRCLRRFLVGSMDSGAGRASGGDGMTRGLQGILCVTGRDGRVPRQADPAALRHQGAAPRRTRARHARLGATAAGLGAPVTLSLSNSPGCPRRLLACARDWYVFLVRVVFCF